MVEETAQVSAEYEFTQNWFHWAPEIWAHLTTLLPKETERKFIEVGSFEGRSAVWMMEHMMQEGDILTCIDTWGGAEDHSADMLEGIEERFDHNILVAQHRFPKRSVRKWKLSSYMSLAEEAQYGAGQYGFAYIDGSHVARDVLTDACLMWPLLKPGGLLVFDDYLWGDPRDVLHRPKIAVDAFTTIFAEEAEIVHVGYQLVLKKQGAS